MSCGLWCSQKIPSTEEKQCSNKPFGTGSSNLSFKSSYNYEFNRILEEWKHTLGKLLLILWQVLHKQLRYVSVHILNVKAAAASFLYSHKKLNTSSISSGTTESKFKIVFWNTHSTVCHGYPIAAVQPSSLYYWNIFINSFCQKDSRSFIVKVLNPGNDGCLSKILYLACECIHNCPQSNGKRHLVSLFHER